MNDTKITIIKRTNGAWIFMGALALYAIGLTKYVFAQKERIDILEREIEEIKSKGE